MRHNLKKRVECFTTISNSVLNDRSLSYKARGILCYLLSKPDDWQVLPKYDLSKRITDYGRNKQDPEYSNIEGERSVRNGLRELKEAGYLEWERYYEDGKIAGINYYIFDKKQDNLNNENLNNENLNKEDLNYQNFNNEDLNNENLKNKDFNNENLHCQNVNEQNSNDYIKKDTTNKKEKNKKEKDELTSPNGFDFDTFFSCFKKDWQKKCKQPSTDGIYEFVIWEESKEEKYKNLLRKILYKQETDTDTTAKAILKQITVYQKYFECKYPTKYRNTIESLLKQSYWDNKYDLPQKAEKELNKQELLEEFKQKKDKFDLHYGEAGRKIKQSILQDQSIFELWGNKAYLEFKRSTHDWLVKIEGGELVWECENQFNNCIYQYITNVNKSNQIIKIINKFVS